MKVNRKQVYVHRWMIDTFIQPTRKYTASNFCGQTLCVNPKHWDLRFTDPEPVEIPPAPYNPDEPWTYQEAENLLDMYQTTEDPTLVEGIPHELQAEYYRKNSQLKGPGFW